MPDPRSAQNAARLSEDIGDVLSAIRKLIAEDEALGGDRAAGPGGTIDQDAGEFLARRYGGNAALARRLAGTAAPDESRSDLPQATARADDEAGEGWPLGGLANSPEAARPVAALSDRGAVTAQPRILRHDGLSAPADAPAFQRAEARPELPSARNDLVRSLSATAAAPQVGRQDAGAVAPLRLDATRRVLTQDDGTGLRGGARQEPPLHRPPLHRPPLAPAAPAPLARQHEDDDDFAEAFDWKARMRPDVDGSTRADATSPAHSAPSLPSFLSGRIERREAPVTVVATRSDDGLRADLAAPDEGRVLDDTHHDPEDAQAEVAGSPSAADSEFAAVLAALEAVGAPRTGLDKAPIPEAGPAQDTAQAMLTAPAAPEACAPEPAAGPTLAGEAAIVTPEVDEQSIRDLLREMIQEELHGELGERFSRNLRAVIRREVAAAIEDYLDRI
ncbi:hypothetical protein [Paracoccus spongiarum]|uniref:DUF2497 domain-containing protein n=1 Tax=Paracoccus spongiarum TaxID=3064387 RepID=A0ABT9J7X9_9RHOB|nr:hypothetical protein [Paracoccus sp. 2205BS29-5]MDP5305916.1 hypothetical protein [Paracoccus sp. 2205BS29-5]